MPIIPNYIRYPDLYKTWEIPQQPPKNAGDRPAQFQEYRTTAEGSESETSSQETSTGGVVTAKGTKGADWKEVLVYRNSKCIQNLVGAVFIRPHESLQTLLDKVQAQLNLFSAKVYRNNGYVDVPLHRNQLAIEAFDFFPSGTHVLVLKE